MSDFLAMGGYAAYIWPCYGLTAAVLAGLLIWSLRDRKRQLDAVAHLETANTGTGSHEA